MIEAQSGGDKAIDSAVLWLVATPIGHLGDFSARARETLAGAELILAEDTRVLARLLAAAGLSARGRIVSAHEHNEVERVAEVIEYLQMGQPVAFVSDAGMPVVSDPGFVLVRAILAAGFPVRVVPGPSAAVTALAASGLPPDRFRFVGFLPPTGARRDAALRACLDAHETQILFESSHRIASLLETLARLSPKRRVSVQRELTKRHEEHVLATADALPGWLAEDGNRSRGEFVVIIEAAPDKDADADWSPEVERLLTTLAGQLPARVLARAVADAFGLNTNRVAQYLMTRDASEKAGSRE